MRLPPWLVGTFVTPFRNGGEAGRGASPEEHTYYCDGSFSFGRGSQARVCVQRLSTHPFFLAPSLPLYSPPPPIHTCTHHFSAAAIIFQAFFFWRAWLFFCLLFWRGVL